MDTIIKIVKAIGKQILIIDKTASTRKKSDNKEALKDNKKRKRLSRAKKKVI